MELRSPTDNLKLLQAKMLEYIENGCQLAWLIDPKFKTVEIYSPIQPVQTLKSPANISGENILINFVLDLSEILY